jgi:hypothetical protein
MAAPTPSPFDLDRQADYLCWRDEKLACHPKSTDDLVVDVSDPRDLSDTEHAAMQSRCALANMVIYRSPIRDEDKRIASRVAKQMGLHRLDGNWLADEDGISQIAVATPIGDRSAFIPYTTKPIKWHTDGYYHPQSRCIRAMVLHCVRKATSGGDTALMDHEMAYIALRDANPEWVRALMAPDAMTIPQRLDDNGVARAEQAGPVFSVDPSNAVLHMRYTARTRSIVWKNDALTRGAVAFLAQLLASDSPHIFRLTLEPGMGLVCNNVLHDRCGFVDDPLVPRLLYRARYLDRINVYGKVGASPDKTGVSSYLINS